MLTITCRLLFHHFFFCRFALPSPKQILKMKKQNRLIQFGEEVEGYNIPVLNEREIRASAGILFVLMLISLFMILSNQDFLMIKYMIIVFLTDLIIRVFINPRFSPSLIIGRLIVRNQVPEYVGAQQKRFAWIIGIVIASIMFTFLVIVNAFSPITGIGCLICLVFLFFESAFGICLGCIVYKWIYKKKAQYCPGEVCDVKSRQAIQKTSLAQWLIVFALVVYIVVIGMLFNNKMTKQPYDLFGINQTAKSK
jgi:hypothetical protein